MSEARLFQDVIRGRRSPRSFLPTPVPQDVLKSVFEDARNTPSNCNYQPWIIHIASGTSRDKLSAAFLEAAGQQNFTWDFPFDFDSSYGIYTERRQAQGAGYYEAAGVPRDATEQRNFAVMKNLQFFGAPHVALLFMAPVYETVRVAGDVGMYGQSLLLSLEAHGLGGVPQTLLSFFAGTAREVLGIDPMYKMLFGISFGYPVPGNPVNNYPLDKAPIEETVTFHN
ncbi:nitroreductase [Flavisphingomonas formosensis]|uniref:nitroreductase n=1 Tax=Flavisphingomonas formosensis TaxID=861534 RepID=UPI0012F73576|nr:nitroreductase [Sphingomonas formosensis]